MLQLSGLFIHGILPMSFSRYSHVIRNVLVQIFSVSCIWSEPVDVVHKNVPVVVPDHTYRQIFECWFDTYFTFYSIYFCLLRYKYIFLYSLVSTNEHNQGWFDARLLTAWNHRWLGFSSEVYKAGNNKQQYYWFILQVSFYVAYE